eukprot:m.190827 g.190827  ORF g.190827 m.190827 type:complete len:189 (+) comp18142_c0_seq1:22-588(+)
MSGGHIMAAAATVPLRGWRQAHHSIRTASLSAAATMVRDSSSSYKQHQAGTLRLPASYIMTYHHTTLRPLSTTVAARQGQAPRFKAMIMLKRKDGISREEFADWWLTQHRDLALKLPKLQKYAVNIVRPVGPSDPEPEYDGVAELWFETEADLLAAYETDIGAQVAADSIAQVCKRYRMLTDEHLFEP